MIGQVERLRFWSPQIAVKFLPLFVIACLFMGLFVHRIKRYNEQTAQVERIQYVLNSVEEVAFKTMDEVAVFHSYDLTREKKYFDQYWQKRIVLQDEILRLQRYSPDPIDPKKMEKLILLEKEFHRFGDSYFSPKGPSHLKVLFQEKGERVLDDFMDQVHLIRDEIQDLRNELYSHSLQSIFEATVLAVVAIGLTLFWSFRSIFLGEKKRREIEDDAQVSRSQVDPIRDYAMICLNPLGIVLSWNFGAQLLTGIAQAKAIGKDFFQIFPELGPEVSKFHEGRMLYSNTQAKLTLKDGRTIIIQLSLTHEPLGNTSLILHDITANEETKQRLLETEERFRSMLESAYDAIIIIDESGRINYSNQQAVNLFGWKEEELKGEVIEILMPERYRDLHVIQRNEYMKHPQARPMGKNLSLWGQKKDGEIFPVEIALSPIRVKDSLLIAAAVRDITERLQFEETEKVLSQLGEVTISLNPSEMLKAVTEILVQELADWAAVEILDKEKSRIHSKNFYHEGEIFDDLKAPVPQLIPTISQEFLQSRIFDPEKIKTFLTYKIRSAIAVPLSFRGKYLGSLTLLSQTRRYTRNDLQLTEEIANRVTIQLENVKLYHAAEEAVTARENIVSVVSHDLKSPLAAINLTAAMMKRKIQAADVASEIKEDCLKKLTTIETSNNHAIRLIKDLLDLSKLKDKGLDIILGEVSVDDLLEKINTLFTPIAASHHLKLEVSSDVHEIITCDGERILQVLTNLVSNAIKHTRVGSITVKAIKNQNRVRFSVTDTGSGIPKEHIPRLFDKFWQAKDTRGSLGLGLSIAKGIITQHQGKIWAESEVGKGSTFIFEIPTHALT